MTITIVSSIAWAILGVVMLKRWTRGVARRAGTEYWVLVIACVFSPVLAMLLPNSALLGASLAGGGLVAAVTLLAREFTGAVNGVDREENG